MLKRLIIICILTINFISAMDQGPEDYQVALQKEPIYYDLFAANKAKAGNLVKIDHSFLLSFFNQTLKIGRYNKKYKFKFPQMDDPAKFYKMPAWEGCNMIQHLMAMAYLKTNPDICATYHFTQRPDPSSGIYDLNVMLLLFTHFVNFYAKQHPVLGDTDQLANKHRHILEAFAIKDIHAFDRSHKKTIETAFNLEPAFKPVTVEDLIKLYIPSE